jgi:hypothetical protein
MKNRLLSFMFGVLGFCAGFALCFLLVFPSRHQRLSAGSRVQTTNVTDTTRELAELVLQLRDAYQHHDVTAYDRVWADEFTASDPSGERRSKADLLRQMQSSGFELKGISDIRVRDYGDFPVVTYRSVGIAKLGTNQVPCEFLSSEQYRRSSVQEAAAGLGHWRAVSAQHMSVHQAPLNDKTSQQACWRRRRAGGLFACRTLSSRRASSRALGVT